MRRLVELKARKPFEVDISLEYSHYQNKVAMAATHSMLSHAHEYYTALVNCQFFLLHSLYQANVHS